MTRARLPTAVWALGWVSFCTDVASEMIVPLLPVFVAGLGASMVQLGVLQGASELVVALAKLWSGRRSDRRRTRKPWLVFGYGLSALLRPLVAVAATPLHVVLVRSADRLGKGLRSAPRDALLADCVGPARRGEAFGLQRAMDHAGALLGALTGAALLAAGCELRLVFALALVPGVVGVGVLVAGVRDLPAAAAPPAAAIGDRAATRLLPFLVVVALAAASGTVDLFALARAAELGVPVAALPLLWAVLHAVRAGLARPLGALSDRLGRRRVIGTGLCVHALVMLGFAAADAAAWTWPLFAAHGLHAAFTEGAERGYVAAVAGTGRRGQVFGRYHAVQGVAAFAGPLLLGAIWDRWGPAVAFGAAAAVSLLAALLLAARVPPAPPAGAP